MASCGLALDEPADKRVSAGFSRAEALGAIAMEAFRLYRRGGQATDERRGRTLGVGLTFFDSIDAGRRAEHAVIAGKRLFTFAVEAIGDAGNGAELSA